MSDVFVYQNSPDTVQIVDKASRHAVEEFIVCDDCKEAYLSPPYYSWDGNGCTVTETSWTGSVVEIPHVCTFNMCPDCTGPYLEPDDEDDPRRPKE